MNEDVINALKIMGFGMAGIFAAIIIIMICVWILQKLDNVGKKKKTE